MKKLVAAAFVLLVVAGAAIAQAPSKILDQRTLDKFLEDFPKIEAGGRAAGLEVKESTGASAEAAMASGSISQMMRDGINSMKQNPEAQKLISNHGWDDGFWDVFFVIGVSHVAVSMQEAFEGQAIPAEMKPFMDDLLGAAHPDDISLVKKNRAKITAVLTGEAME